MAFDLSTATPAENTGFDLSTANPVQDAQPTQQDNTPDWASPSGKFGSMGPNIYGLFGATKEVARFAGETAGLVGGGIIGAGAGLLGGGPVGAAVGGVAGAGLGYGAVKSAERFLEGERATIPEALATGVKDIATGSAMQAAGPIVGKVAQKIVSPMASNLTDKVTGELTKETQAYMDAVKATGYNPTAAEIHGGQSKFMSMVEGLLSYLPGSASNIHRARLVNISKLVDVRKELLAKGANERTIENVGYRIKEDASNLIKNVTKGRKDIKSEQLDAMVNTFMSDVNATTGGTVRESSLSNALNDFYNSTGTATSLSSAGKTVQDMMAQKKTDMFSSAGEKYKAATTAFKNDTVEINNTQQMASQLLAEELQSNIPNPSIIKVLRPYVADEGLLDKALPANLKGMSAEDLKKKFPQVYEALMSSVNRTKNTWLGLDLDRQKLGKLARESNILKGTEYTGSKGSTDPEGRIFTMLRNSLEEDMASHAQKTNPEALKTFMGARKEWREAHEMFDKDILGMMKKSPEDVFKSVVGKGEVENIRKMKEVLGEEGFAPFKQILTRKLIATDKNGIIDIAKTSKNINSYGETIGEVYTKEERQGLSNLLNKSKGIEDDFTRSKLMSDTIKVDSNGIINLEATKKALIKNKENLSNHYSEEELTNFDSMLGNVGKINLKALARNKQEGLQFLGTIAGASNEGVVNAIVKPNNTINIRYMQRLLGPERSKEVGTKFIENYLTKIESSGAFSPIKSAKIFNNYEKTLKQLFDPQTYKEVSNLMEISRRASTIDRLAMNPSQTGQTLIGFETGKELLNSATNLSMKSMAFSGGLALGPYGLAKIYLSPVGRQWLSIGYRIPAKSKEGIELVAKLTALAGGREEKQPEQIPQPPVQQTPPLTTKDVKWKELE